MSEALSSNLLMLVFEFLNLQDFKSLVITCKQFNNTILSHNRFWARECLTGYLSFDLELYSETYASEDYKSCIQAKLGQMQQNPWKQLLAEASQFKKALGSSMSQLGCRDEIQGFLNHFYETLKQPTLPMVTLKRENIACTAQTLFQTKLSEVLYEDTGLLAKKGLWIDDARKLIDRLQTHHKKISQEMLQHDKNDIIRARWYNFDSRETGDSDETISFAEEHSDFCMELPALPDLTKISNASTDDLQISRCRNTLLMNLYTSLCGVVVHHCNIIYTYLASLNDPYLLVAEYTARWEAFVCSIMELEGTFTTFTDLMNSQYETIFEGYPGFPKFSLWRLMAKIWLREVYDKCEMPSSLSAAFLKIFNSFREGNVNETFQNCMQMNNSGDGSPTDLPKSLFVSLRIKRKQKSLECPYRVASDSTQMPMCFKATPEMRRCLLTSYLRSIQDISLNEVNIHYIDCTNIPNNYPYCELEQAIMKQSTEFYYEYQCLFSSAPEHFCQLLKSDSELLGDILGPRTGSKLQHLQNGAGLNIMKEFVGSKLEELDSQAQTQYKLQLDKQQSVLNESQQRNYGIGSGTGISRPEDELRDYIEDFIDQAIFNKDSNCFCPDQLSSQSSTDCMIEEFKIPQMRSTEQKASIRAAATVLEEMCGSFVPILAFFKERQDFLKTVDENDKMLRQSNIDKNIPCEMSDVDSLFYDMDKNITIGLLEKLFEDYMVFAKQQERELQQLQQEENDRLQGLSPVMRQQAVQFEHNLPVIDGMQPQGDDILDEDMDNLDFLGLGEPVLRRNMY